MLPGSSISRSLGTLACRQHADSMQTACRQHVSAEKVSTTSTTSTTCEGFVGQSMLALRNAAAILSYQGPDTSNVMTVAWHVGSLFMSQNIRKGYHALHASAAARSNVTCCNLQEPRLSQAACCAIHQIPWCQPRDRPGLFAIWKWLMDFIDFINGS